MSDILLQAWNSWVAKLVLWLNTLHFLIPQSQRTLQSNLWQFPENKKNLVSICFLQSNISACDPAKVHCHARKRRNMIDEIMQSKTQRQVKRGCIHLHLRKTNQVFAFHIEMTPHYIPLVGQRLPDSAAGHQSCPQPTRPFSQNLMCIAYNWINAFTGSAFISVEQRGEHHRCFLKPILILMHKYSVNVLK